jgi:hypothetical protein
LDLFIHLEEVPDSVDILLFKKSVFWFLSTGGSAPPQGRKAQDHDSSDLAAIKRIQSRHPIMLSWALADD